MIESDVKRAVKKLLTEIGAYWFMPVPTGYGARTVDFLVCWRGAFYGIETKRPGVDQPTPEQALAMSKIVHAGGAACLENDPALPAVRRMFNL